ncbi:DUF3168 domain-containing protein [Planktotalea sp.]|uniref:DUF3168 domain-containing protein n=1 Tax=Planktotalea sp. TaxID=2029877 RepID=UPI003D6B58BF
MADEIALELQAALIASIRGSSELTDFLAGRAYATLPPVDKLAFPFAQIGPIEPRPLYSDCSRSERVIFSIEVISGSAGEGQVEVSRGAGLLKDLLDGNPLDLATHRMVSINWKTQTYEHDALAKRHSMLVVFSSVIDE